MWSVTGEDRWIITNVANMSASWSFLTCSIATVVSPISSLIMRPMVVVTSASSAGLNVVIVGSGATTSVTSSSSWTCSRGGDPNCCTSPDLLGSETCSPLPSISQVSSGSSTNRLWGIFVAVLCCHGDCFLCELPFAYLHQNRPDFNIVLPWQ